MAANLIYGGIKMKESPEVKQWRESEQKRLGLTIEQFDKIMKLAVNMDSVLGLTDSYYRIASLIELKRKI